MRRKLIKLSLIVLTFIITINSILGFPSSTNLPITTTVQKYNTKSDYVDSDAPSFTVTATPAAVFVAAIVVLKVSANVAAAKANELAFQRLQHATLGGIITSYNTKADEEQLMSKLD